MCIWMKICILIYLTELYLHIWIGVEQQKPPIEAKKPKCKNSTDRQTNKWTNWYCELLGRVHVHVRVCWDRVKISSWITFNVSNKTFTQLLPTFDHVNYFVYSMFGERSNIWAYCRMKLVILHVIDFISFMISPFDFFLPLQFSNQFSNFTNLQI